LERNTITRRQILRGAGLVGVGTVLGSSLALAGARRGSEGGGAGSGRPWYELGIIGEPIMDDQLLWYLSHTGQGMADIGEWPEETMWAVEGAVRRGYHSLTFHGPGQGMALREQGLTFRPDWEKVITPVIDFTLGLPGVELEAIILMGLSMGGALAPRAAAFEKRIKICIADPGVLNWAGAMYEHFEGYGLLELLEVSPGAFNTAAEELTRAWPTAKWWFRDAAWKHGANSPAELFAKLEDYNNEAIVDRISCRMLVMDGMAEEFSPGQAKKLYDALQCPKDYMLFTEEDTGLVHCQAGAPSVASQRMFDWLDEHI
jgi:hypothetical protein